LRRWKERGKARKGEEKERKEKDGMKHPEISFWLRPCIQQHVKVAVAEENVVK